MSFSLLCKIEEAAIGDFLYLNRTKAAVVLKKKKEGNKTTLVLLLLVELGVENLKPGKILRVFYDHSKNRVLRRSGNHNYDIPILNSLYDIEFKKPQTLPY